MTIQTLCDLQRAYFHSQITKPMSFRLAMLKRLKSAIISHIPMINAALKEDLNKSEPEAYLSEIGLVLAELSMAIKSLPKWMRPKRVRTPLALFHAKSRLDPEPLGMVLIMSPWNYPFQLAMVPLIGAIAAGNTAIVKPASYAKATSLVIQTILKDVFSEEYVACVLGGREENQLLLDQPFDYIFFTGSTAVARFVMEKASKHLTPVTLELGGKSPCIIDHHVDLGLVARRIAFGKFLNSGQTCVAPDYLYIHQEDLDSFIREMALVISEFYGPDPLQNPDYPKIINQKHYDRLIQLMRHEKAALGGNGDGVKIAPTLLIDVSDESPIMQEEIFGPILPILTYQSIDQVIEKIRSRPKPLALYLFSQDKSLQKRILNQLSFGGATINDTIMHVASTDMGFGGIGDSGMGRYHGIHSFYTFTNLRSVLYRGNWIDLSTRYHPYTKSKQALIRLFLK